MVVSSLEHIFSYLWEDRPWHLLVEILLLILIVLLLFRKPQPIKRESDDLTVAEQDELIAEWKPQPFVPDSLPDDADPAIFNEKVVTSGPSDTIEVDGKRAINLAVPNYFGLNMAEPIVSASVDAIDKYAVGTCGPRQFYGTMDVHLELEDSVAEWAGTEESVGYCYPFATTTSVIQAFCHNTDVVFVDSAAWFAVQLGAILTRGKIYVYEHNNMEELRRLVIKAKAEFPRWDKCNRWVLTEGLFANDGTICNLPEIMKIREEFCLRTIIDETHSFGVLGATGRGVCEHFSVPRSSIEVCIGSFGTAFASLGGFTIGTHEVCAHQRLSSHAYIFSASPPSFNVVAANTAVQMVSKDGAKRITTQRSNAKFARELLEQLPAFDILGDIISPLIHLRLKKELPLKDEDALLEKICDRALADAECPTAITKSKYCRYKEPNPPRPTIKLYISPAHSKDQIKQSIDTLKRSAEELIK